MTQIFLATILPWNFVFLAFLLEKVTGVLFHQSSHAITHNFYDTYVGAFVWYVCVLRGYHIDWDAHAYYAISVYVCGECTCWLSPDIYSCIHILNMYIECRCPAYTYVYVMNLGWQFFSTLFFANCCPLLLIFTEAALCRRNGEMCYQSFILKRRLLIIWSHL